MKFIPENSFIFKYTVEKNEFNINLPNGSLKFLSVLHKMNILKGNTNIM